MSLVWHVYTDASSPSPSPSPSPSSSFWSGIGIYMTNGIKSRTISNKIPTDDNNYAELYAIYIAAILINGKEAIVHTDSQTAIAYIEGKISRRREDFGNNQSGWIRYNQMKVLAYKIRRANPNLKVEKVKAHVKQNDRNHVGNNIADLLAKRGRG